MPIVTANGIDIAYETSGNPDGPPVLLVMGLGMQLVSWPADFVHGLERQGCFVIRFDNRDSGLSSKFDQAGVPNLPLSYVKSLVGWPLRAAYLLSDMAADARCLLDVLRIDRAHVIGASMGGMIAQIFAAEYPERTLSLTSIMSTSGRRGLPGPTRAARRALMRIAPDGAERDQLIEHMAQTFRVIGSPGFPTPEKLVRDRIALSIDRCLCPGGVARQLVAIAASGDRSPLLRQIVRPSLVIHGAADPLVPVACGIDTAKRIAGAALHVIDGMGHDLPPQLIPRFIALIKPFLFSKIVPHAVAG